MLAVPQTAVAASARALKYMLDELTRHQRRADLQESSKQLIATEIMDVMDANKALFSALPVSDGGAAKLAKAFEQYIEDSEFHMTGLEGDPDCELVDAKAALAAWKEGR